MVETVKVVPETDYNNPIQVERGRRYTIVGNYSECAMHMRISDTLIDFEIVGEKYPMAQLYRDGRKFSSPITLGECGVYTDHGGDRGMYFYPPKGVPQPDTVTVAVD